MRWAELAGEELHIFRSAGYWYYSVNNGVPFDPELEIARHDEHLVAAVDERIAIQGTEERENLSYPERFDLRVVEIPIDDYMIEEYNGYESVSEPHRTWYFWEDGTDKYPHRRPQQIRQSHDCQ
jgi:hypothetical protein